MWYKFNPFEGSVRVPMIAAGPKFKAGHMETALTTLADLLPTFADIASARHLKIMQVLLMGVAFSHYPHPIPLMIQSILNIAVKAFTPQPSCAVIMLSNTYGVETTQK